LFFGEAAFAIEVLLEEGDVGLLASLIFVELFVCRLEGGGSLNV
jgi:hypothetical protein